MRMHSQDEKYMRRALQLAAAGEGHTAPNPAVGAVVVAQGRIIGEGFHREYGGPHAEVNAINSIAGPDRHLLAESTIYVTLEPCSHYGKTPPCAKLIIDSGIHRVVAGAPDPNPLVSGRGFDMLRKAGIEVTEGILLHDCLSINRRFMTAHSLKRPWILLKWAQSADGFMAGFDKDGKPTPVKFSNNLSSVWMHRERASVQSILAGRNTVLTDRPLLNVRHWGGKNPIIIPCPSHLDIHSMLNHLFSENIHSLMVEGGPTLLRSFLKAGLFDEIRIETSPAILGEGLRSPSIPFPDSGETAYSTSLKLISTETSRGNIITTYRR